MAFLTGLVLLDAPASALNNAGSEEARERTTRSRSRKSVLMTEFTLMFLLSRFGLAALTLEQSSTDWVAAPVFREKKIAFSESDPITNWDDDLFGYMRAQSKKGGETEKAANQSRPRMRCRWRRIARSLESLSLPRRHLCLGHSGQHCR